MRIILASVLLLIDCVSSKGKPVDQSDIAFVALMLIVGLARA